MAREFRSFRIIFMINIAIKSCAVFACATIQCSHYLSIIKTQSIPRIIISNIRHMTSRSPNRSLNLYLSRIPDTTNIRVLIADLSSLATNTSNDFLIRLALIDTISNSIFNLLSSLIQYKAKHFINELTACQWSRLCFFIKLLTTDRSCCACH